MNRETYDVWLVVEDEVGQRDSSMKTITIPEGLKPAANFSYQLNGTSYWKAGAEVDFVDESISFNPITGRRWLIDGEEVKATQTREDTRYDHPFSKKGNYEVTLEVVTEEGKSDTITRVISVPGFRVPPWAIVAASVAGGTVGGILFSKDDDGGDDDDGLGTPPPFPGNN